MSESRRKSTKKSKDDPYLSVSKAFVQVHRPGHEADSQLFDVENEEIEIVKLTKLIEPQYQGQIADSQLSEAHLKSAVSESQQIIRNLKQSLQDLETVAADLTEFTNLNDNQNDSNDSGNILNHLDEHVRDLIQEIRFIEFRKDQLEEIRESVHHSNSNRRNRDNDQNNFTHFHHELCLKLSSELSSWQNKTSRQKFSHDPLYKAFRERIWEASGVKDVMPPLKTFLPAENEEEEDEEEESGEELEVVGGTQNYKCPLCLGYLVEPMRSTQCNHAFCKKCFEGYLEQTRSEDAACPHSGCSKRLTLSDVVLDSSIAARIRQICRRQQMRQDTTDIFEDHTHLDQDNNSKPNSLPGFKHNPSQKKRRIVVDDD